MGDPGRSKMAGNGKPTTERSAIWTEIRKVCIDEYEEKRKNENGTGEGEGKKRRRGWKEKQRWKEDQTEMVWVRGTSGRRYCT
jgi:hypothetical protein